jgi:hypothetical protein
MQYRGLNCRGKCGGCVGFGGSDDHRQHAFAFSLGFERERMKLKKLKPWLAGVLVAATVSSSALPVAFATSTAPSPPSQPHTPIAQETLEAIEALGEKELALLTALFETSAQITQL